MNDVQISLMNHTDITPEKRLHLLIIESDDEDAPKRTFNLISSLIKITDDGFTDIVVFTKTNRDMYLNFASRIESDISYLEMLKDRQNLARRAKQPIIRTVAIFDNIVEHNDLNTLNFISSMCRNYYITPILICSETKFRIPPEMRPNIDCVFAHYHLLSQRNKMRVFEQVFRDYFDAFDTFDSFDAFIESKIKTHEHPPCLVRYLRPTNCKIFFVESSKN